MSPLWMEMEAGTCSWLVGVVVLPLPLPLLLKWSSTQEPAQHSWEHNQSKPSGFVETARTVTERRRSPASRYSRTTPTPWLINAPKCGAAW